MPRRRWVLLPLLATAACATLPSSPAVPRPAEALVAFDRSGITRSEAGGLADRTRGRRTTIDDPVRIASVSKLVVGLGVMRLVEAGTLDLDRDVSDWLGWRLRNPAFADAPITLRLLLGHRSSLTDGADYAIPLGETLQRRLSDPRAWDARRPPGGFYRYTNLNFPVVASVMERATGERFDRLMQRLVLAPLKLDACFNWTTCSDAAVARAVVLYDASGKAVRDWPADRDTACPVNHAGPCALTGYRPGDNGALFSPQGGLRISMRDLATIGRMMLNDGDGFLRPASLAALERVAWDWDGSNGVPSESGDRISDCRYGMAMQTLASGLPGCGDDPFGDGRPRVGHAGNAYALRSGLWLDRARGTGVAFFTTAVPDDARSRRSAFSPQEERLMRRKR